jgi:hypothetical protein
MRIPLRVVSSGLAILCLAAVVTSAGSAAGSSTRTYTTGPTQPLRTALFDLVNLNGRKELPFTLTHDAGAQYVRLIARWSSIAPATRPDGFDAADPSSPGYSWTTLDASVEAAESAGLTPYLDITATPNWAYRKRPSGPNEGTPRTVEIAAFATALATHYDGQHGPPPVHDFEVWNEPNLSLDLGPAKAGAYRTMVNAVADSVHAVDPDNLVIAGGLDPFGHHTTKTQKWYSIAPLAFMRSVLCLSKGSHPHSTCASKIHFDVWSHHPYTFGGPFAHAKLPDDVSLGDLPKMRALLKAGVESNHVVSQDKVQFWVSEFAWDTNPPRPHAASPALAARWTEESLYQAWRSGVSLLTWFGLEDQKGPSPYQSGLYYHAHSLDAARPKPVLTAFRFPFVAYLGKGKVRVWGRDATSDQERVTVKLRHGKNGNWRTVGTIESNSNGIFQATLKPKATKKDWLKASAPGSGKSLPFSLTVPHHPHIGPWGSH